MKAIWNGAVLAESDDALAASHPEQRMPRVGAGDERRELLGRLGAHDQPRVGGVRRRGIRVDHRTSLRPPDHAASSSTTRTPCQKATYPAISEAAADGVG